ncbi:MAG: T9SS type A sorting domain-containing protein [Bacteroidetes bacterium]|nr:T9SS type A sorting domain-containing protein [Bacteroidota bacterium]
MKLILLTLIISLSSLSFGQLGNLPNSSFENWQVDSTLELKTWTTFGAFNEGTAKRVQSAQNQKFAVELTSQVSPGDTNVPILAYGNFSTGFRGQPYAFVVDSLIFYAKFNVPANTNAEVTVAQFNQGVPTFTTLPITGTQATWARLGIELTSPFQDSIAIIVSSSPVFGVFDAKNGSTITVDNFSLKGLTAGPALTNFSLENYDSTATNSLEDYRTTNEVAGFLQYNGEFVTRTTDKQSGTYAARLETISVGQFGDIPGVISNAFNDQFDITNGQPYTGQPDSLTGFYKYSPTMGDVGFVYVAFTKNGNTVAEGEFEMIASQTTYKRFGMKFQFTDVPDSMAIIIYSGDMDGSVLHVDNFNFKGGNVGIAENEKLVSLVYPNPASEEVMITLNARPESIQIFDVSGQIVKTINTSSVLTSVNISDLASGTYLVNVISKTGVATTKFVKK